MKMQTMNKPHSTHIDKETTVWLTTPKSHFGGFFSTNNAASHTTQCAICNDARFNQRHIVTQPVRVHRRVDASPKSLNPITQQRIGETLSEVGNHPVWWQCLGPTALAATEVRSNCFSDLVRVVAVAVSETLELRESDGVGRISGGGITGSGGGGAM